MIDEELARIYILIGGILTLPFAFMWSFGWGIAWICALFVVLYTIYLDWEGL